jgi:glycosyltransferase involved in cell wall biosynthesis
MAVPTIATPAGGTTELLRHKETGLVVPIDDVEELANAIRDLSVDSELRTSYGSNARSLVEKNFSQEAYVSNFEQFLDNLSRS